MTIILVLVMATSVFFGYKQRPEVLLIPVATLFAFTQLRQSMPGAPDGFGMLIMISFSRIISYLLIFLRGCCWQVSKSDRPGSTTNRLFADLVGLVPCLALLALTVSSAHHNLTLNIH